MNYLAGLVNYMYLPVLVNYMYLPVLVNYMYLPGLVNYHVARNFHRRKLSRIGGNKTFVKKSFADCPLVPPNNAMPPNFAEKTFMNSHKISKLAKVFSLKSFPLYGTYRG